MHGKLGEILYVLEIIPLLKLQCPTRAHHQTIAIEFTGGLLSNAFTDVLVHLKRLGSVVCYHEDTKIEHLGIPESILMQHDVVSATAVALATGAAESFSSDYGLSTTGFAGPTGGSSRSRRHCVLDCTHHRCMDASRSV